MFVPGVNGSVIPSAPSGSRLKGAYKNSKKRKMPNGGSVLSMGDYDVTTAPKKGNYLLPDINRPGYIDSEGGRRTEYKMGVNIDGKETLLPTVVGGKQLTEDEAINRYYKTGLNMGKFNTPQEAEYASRLRTARYNMLEDPVRFKANQFKDGGWDNWTPNVGKPYLRTSPAGNAGYTDNTKVVTQNTNVSAANRKAAEAAEYAKRVGSVSQGKTKSSYEKAKEASSFVSQAEQRKGSADPLDYVLDAVNPTSLSFAATDLVGNTGSAVSNVAQGNFKEAGSDLLNAGLNALQVIPAASELRGPLKSAGKYLTTQTPLKNTYKYNPWAFKPNEANWYRQVGKSGVDDAFQTGLVREAGEEVSPRMLQEFESQLSRMQGSGSEAMLASRRPASPFFGKGELFYPMDRKPIISKTGKLSKNPAGKGDADYLIETSLPNESFQPAYVKGMSLGVPREVGQTAILKPNPSLRTIDNFNFYKRDWLQGYKPINSYKDGGKASNDKQMVDGVASILRRVEDKQNRLKLANQLSKQFNREKVKYDLASFLKKSKVKK